MGCVKHLPVPAAEYQQLRQRVAAHWVIDESRLDANTRQEYVVEARHTLWLALRLRGYSVQSVAITVQKDHSTVVHALAKAVHLPKVTAMAKHINKGSLPQHGHSMLGYLPAGHSIIVLDYLRALANGEPLNYGLCAAVALIASSPRLQKVCQRILAEYDLGMHFWRICHHAQRLGYCWVTESRPEGPSALSIVLGASLRQA